MATPTEEEVPEAAAPAPAAVRSGEDHAKMAAAPPADYEEFCLGESYEAHEKYVRRLRKAGKKEKLRAVRENMNNLFPFTPKMWLEWVWDEISLSKSDKSFDDIEKLFERGVQEYLSVFLWLVYLAFVWRHDQSVSQFSPAGLAKMRDLFERAITAGGLHVAEGSKLWAVYRKYEMAILTTIADGKKEEKAKQVQRIRTLFHRQLSVPLADMESTLAEYKTWEAGQGNENDHGSDFDGIPSNVISDYKRANDMYNERKQYEDQLSNASASEDDKLEEFLQYIKFEESKGDNARVQVLYERAVSDLPDSRDLWTEYTTYLDRAVPSVLKNVYHRATRNCRWASELWCCYLLCLECIHACEEELKHVYKKAIKCRFATDKDYDDIYLTRVDSLRRRMSDGLDFQLIRVIFTVTRLKEHSNLKAKQEAEVDLYSDPSDANDSSRKRKAGKMINKQEPPTKIRKENAPESTSDDQGSNMVYSSSTHSGSSSPACQVVLQKAHIHRATERVAAARYERKLALLEQQVKIQKEMLRLQQREREDRLMALDVDKMAPWAREYIIALQKQIAVRTRGGDGSAE